MKKTWELSGKVLLWIATIFMLIMSLGTIPHWSFFIALLVAILVAPVKKWQLLLKRFLPKTAKTVVAIALVVAFFIAMPKVEGTVPQGENDNPVNVVTHDITTTAVSTTCTSTNAITGHKNTTTMVTTENKTTVSVAMTEKTTKITTQNATTKKVTTLKATTTQNKVAITYILNTDTKKFHKPNCRHVQKIKAENKGTFNGSRDNLITQGYTACGTCHP